MTAIWVLSFFSPPKTRLDEVTDIDKMVHTAMYGFTCLVLWVEYRRCHERANYRKLLVWAVVAPIVMSGVIELMQEYLTTHRSGEWADLAANSLGVLLAAVCGCLIMNARARRH